ncbi:hypothetical protein LTR16_011589, partial [Cryomyces antarcticus]
FEQLKKQKGKKAGAAKKKDDAPETAEDPAVAPSQSTVDDTTTADITEPSALQEDTTSAEPAVLSPQPTPVEGFAAPEESKQPHARQPSLSIQSKQRSESFRRGSIVQSPTTSALKSPLLGPAGSTDASRIEELEQENKRLKDVEEELEELRA